MLHKFSVNDNRSCVPDARDHKRARIVCHRCHEKKIKCDLRTKVDHQPQTCSNCADADYLCRVRPTRRGTNRRKALPRSAHDPSVAADCIVESEVTAPQPHNPTFSPQQDEAQNTTETARVNSNDLTSFAISPGAVSALPNQSNAISSPSQPRMSYIGDSGYMQIFSHGSGGESVTSPNHQNHQNSKLADSISPGLQQSHLDTFFEYASVWCPVLDKVTYDTTPELQQSKLLRHALALCGNQINPSLIDCTSSLEYYNRAKESFYLNHEPNPIICILSIMLFYWWSDKAPNLVSIDDTWWWTGTAIRLGQQIGLHRELRPGQSLWPGESPELRRRIWWTLVARERMSAIAQGRPCVIDLQDCDIEMPSSEDFLVPQDIRTAVFVRWVPLCEIIGRIGIGLQRKATVEFFAIPLARELINWVQALPPSLELSIQGPHTIGFHRDVHGMYLTYLSSITLLHLDKAAQHLPKASNAAIVAASCTARIFYDYLLRGSVKFLAGIASWYITIAILALLRARRFRELKAHTEADIRILRTALAELTPLWHAAKMFQMGIDTIIESDAQNFLNYSRTAENRPLDPSGLDELTISTEIHWQEYFPFITVETSHLIGILLIDNQTMQIPETDWTFNVSARLDQFFTHPEDLNLDFLAF